MPVSPALMALSFVRRPSKSATNNDTKLTEGPMFGALMEMLQRLTSFR
jgi:hypothetical protein